LFSEITRAHFSFSAKEKASDFLDEPERTGGDHVMLNIWQLMDQARTHFRATHPRVLYTAEEPVAQHPAPLYHCWGGGRPMHEGLATCVTHELNSMIQLSASLGAFRKVRDDDKMVLFRCPGVPP
jgi:hypothetical protein